MMLHLRSVLALALLSLCSLAQAASSAKVDTRFETTRQAFEAAFPGVTVDGIRATPFPNLLEVEVGGTLLYTDPQASFVMQGSLLDSKTRVDLTEQRMQELNRVSLNDLPLDKAIKLVKGDGSRQMVVFEDPNCGYCKRLHTTLQEIDNVTVYSLMFPILGPDSRRKAEDIWCAQNPAKTLSDWMGGGARPEKASCEHPLDQLLAVGQKLRVQGTPAIYFADGSRADGWLPAAQLQSRLDAAAQ
ncbi:DsbC family protein [Alcaligenes phenolicus]|uniref:DsbC family protein n=1 Tax=Alcaligenes TaxID=507 RepID=UPI0009F6BFD0|nr:DsbC family protein [Alcaligenes phenolicus]OQV31773.1 disulfide bond formation protein DsbC [Alcaligenes phenolicus]